MFSQLQKSSPKDVELFTGNCNFMEKFTSQLFDRNMDGEKSVCSVFRPKFNYVAWIEVNRATDLISICCNIVVGYRLSRLHYWNVICFYIKGLPLLCDMPDMFTESRPMALVFSPHVFDHSVFSRGTFSALNTRLTWCFTNLRFLCSHLKDRGERELTFCHICAGSIPCNFFSMKNCILCKTTLYPWLLVAVIWQFRFVVAFMQQMREALWKHICSLWFTVKSKLFPLRASGCSQKAEIVQRSVSYSLFSSQALKRPSELCMNTVEQPETLLVQSSSLTLLFPCIDCGAWSSDFLPLVSTVCVSWSFWLSESTFFIYKEEQEILGSNIVCVDLYAEQVLLWLLICVKSNIMERHLCFCRVHVYCLKYLKASRISQEAKASCASPWDHIRQCGAFTSVVSECATSLG